MKRGLIFAAALAVGLFAVRPVAAQQVRADLGGIAIGGNVINSTIIPGVPLEKVDELVRDRTKPFEELAASRKETIDLLRDKLDLNERQIRATVAILGEKDIPSERLLEKLAEVAEHYKALKRAAESKPGDDPKIASLKWRRRRRSRRATWRKRAPCSPTSGPSSGAPAPSISAQPSDLPSMRPRLRRSKAILR